MRLILTGMIIVLGLGGCASERMKREKESVELERYRAEVRAKHLEEETARKQVFIDELPAWVTSAPGYDPEGVKGVGTGESEILATAVKMAKLQAEFEIAKRIGQELSGSERFSERDLSAGTPDREFTQLIDKLVAEVPVVGYETDEQLVRAIGGKYHAFVLLRLRYDDLAKVIRARRAATDSALTESRFAELEKRIAKRNARLDARMSESGRAEIGSDADKSDEGLKGGTGE